MSHQSRRIIALLIAGAVFAAVGIVARKQVAIHQSAAINAARNNQKLTAEAELVKLYKASRAAPSDKQKQWDLASLYIKYNILDKAADQLAVIIHLDHSDVQAQLKLADLSMLVKGYSVAEFYYREVAKRDNRNILAWQGLASALLLDRRFYESMAAAKRAVDLDKKDPHSHLLLARALLNYGLQFPDPMSHAEYIETAREELAEVVKSLPENGEALYEYSRTLVALQHRQEGIAQLQKCLKVNPNNSGAARLLATTYMHMNRDDLALKVADDLDGRAPDDPATNDLIGQILLDSGKPGSVDKALLAFKKAASKAPKDPYILERLGQAFLKANDLPHARVIFERVTQINSDHPFAYQKLALIYTRLGEPKLAKQAATYAQNLAFNEQQFKTIQELSAKHPNDVGLHLIMAERYNELRMFAPARDEYFLVLKLDPKNKRVPKQFIASASEHMKQEQF